MICEIGAKPQGKDEPIQNQCPLIGGFATRFNKYASGPMKQDGTPKHMPSAIPWLLRRNAPN